MKYNLLVRPHFDDAVQGWRSAGRQWLDYGIIVLDVLQCMDWSVVRGSVLTVDDWLVSLKSSSVMTTASCGRLVTLCLSVCL